MLINIMKKKKRKKKKRHGDEIFDTFDKRLYEVVDVYTHTYINACRIVREGSTMKKGLR